MDLVGGLSDEEEAAKDQDEAPPADLDARHLEERPREPHDPGNAEEQRQPGDERASEPEPAGAGSLLRRQPPGQDRNEDDVVDAENDLERRQRQEADPGTGV